MSMAYVYQARIFYRAAESYIQAHRAEDEAAGCEAFGRVAITYAAMRRSLERLGDRALPLKPITDMTEFMWSHLTTAFAALTAHTEMPARSLDHLDHLSRSMLRELRVQDPPESAPIATIQLSYLPQGAVLEAFETTGAPLPMDYVPDGYPLSIRIHRRPYRPHPAWYSESRTGINQPLSESALAHPFDPATLPQEMPQEWAASNGLAHAGPGDRSDILYFEITTRNLEGTPDRWYVRANEIDEEHPGLGTLLRAIATDLPRFSYPAEDDDSPPDTLATG
jgi:hypothetical protein